MKDWYDENLYLNIFWFISGIVWLPIYVVYEIIERIVYPYQITKPKWLKWWGNRVDNLTDQVIQYLHCNSVPFTQQKYCWNLAFIMKNRGKPYWPIIRKCGYYDNCDPEDLQNE